MKTALSQPGCDAETLLVFICSPQECCWTLAHDVFEVDFSIYLRPLPLQNVHSSISFSAASSVAPVTMSWDFGDLSPRVNTSGSAVASTTHKYSLPGRYVVTVMGWAGNSKVSGGGGLIAFSDWRFGGDASDAVFAGSFQVSARGEVTVMLPPKLELQCPTLVVANQSLEVTLVSWGSVGVDVDWKITKDGVRVAKGKVVRA